MRDLLAQIIQLQQPLTPFADAIALLKAQACVCAHEEKPLMAAQGCVLAAPVIAGHALPPFDNSAMDGYGIDVTSAAYQAGQDFPVAEQVVAAGHPFQGTVPAGTAVRIFTGAPVPAGITAVEMQENTVRDGNRVRFTGTKPLFEGKNIRRAGEDISQGQIVLEAGRRLDAAALAVCAALGVSHVSVYRPLRVGVFSTGDELRDLGQTLSAGTTYDANRYGTQALVAGWGYSATDLGILPDDPVVIEQTLSQHAADYDVILTSGGVSVGGADYVKEAVTRLGHLMFWKLAIKPGKPIALGQIGACAFVGLPGNPVSSFVTTLLLVRPLLHALSGQTSTDPHRFKVPSGFIQTINSARMEWARVRLIEGRAVPYHHMGSGVLSSLIQSDGFVELPLGSYDIKIGDPLDFIPFSEFGI